MSSSPSTYARNNGRDYRYAYAVTYGRPDSDWFVKIDVTTGATQRWSQAGCYPGEPIIVPAPAPRPRMTPSCSRPVLRARFCSCSMR